jgi:hypothetical protein
MPDAPMPDSPVWRLALPLPLPRLFDYLPPVGEAASAGDVGSRVRVPFGSRELVGVIAEVGAAGDDAPQLKHALARLDPQPVFHGELFESLRLIRTIVTELPAGEHRSEPRLSEDASVGAGWVEGWRGEVFVALELDTAGRRHAIRRCHCHDPSWQNWPVLEHAVIGNIVPDFPLINKSFNLSYTGHDL